MLASCPYFTTSRKFLAAGQTLDGVAAERFAIVSVVEGSLRSAGGRHFGKGSFPLLPRGAAQLTAVEDSTVLVVNQPGFPE